MKKIDNWRNGKERATKVPKLFYQKNLSNKNDRQHQIFPATKVSVQENLFYSQTKKKDYWGRLVRFAWGKIVLTYIERMDGDCRLHRIRDNFNFVVIFDDTKT